MLVTPHVFAASIQANTLLTLVRMGQTGAVEAAIAGLDEQQRASAEVRAAVASLRLAQHDPHSAETALAPVTDGSAPPVRAAWMVTALLLGATARDALGAQDAAGRALERALDAAGPDRVLILFLVHPAPALLERHARRHPAHAALIAEVLNLQPGTSPAAPPPADPRSVREPLSQAETASCTTCPPTSPCRKSPASSTCR